MRRFASYVAEWLFGASLLERMGSKMVANANTSTNINTGTNVNMGTEAGADANAEITTNDDADASVKWYLSTGLFLSILFHEKRNNPSPTQTDMLISTANLFDPDFAPRVNEASFKTTASSFCACRSSETRHLPFSDVEAQHEFDRAIRCVRDPDAYIHAVQDMDRLIAKYLDIHSVPHMKQLVKILLWLIEHDAEIDSATELFVSIDGKPITKMQLLQMRTINLPAFLLGVYHFITTSHTANKKGRQAYEYLFTSLGDLHSGKRLTLDRLGDYSCEFELDMTLDPSLPLPAEDEIPEPASEPAAEVLPTPSTSDSSQKPISVKPLRPSSRPSSPPPPAFDSTGLGAKFAVCYAALLTALFIFYFAAQIPT